MSTIVAGRFDTMTDAERAARALYGHGFSVWDVSVFSVGAAEAGQPLARPAGVLLAARVEDERLHLAAQLLRTEGAQDVERAQGRWENGRWTDFDPLRTPVLVEQRQPDERSGDLGDGAFQDTGNEDPGSAMDQSVEAQVGRRDPDAMLDPGGSRAGDPDIEARVRRQMEDRMTGDISRGDRARADAQASGEPRPPSTPVGQPQQKQGPGRPQGSAGGTDAPASGGQSPAAGSGGQSGPDVSGNPSRSGGDAPPLRRGEAWEQAASHRQPDEPAPDPGIGRDHSTAPEPRGPKDTPRQMRQGQFPPGVGEGELRDPGNTTPGAPKVDNRS